MIVALVLLAYAALLAAAGPSIVRRARWVERAPRLGVAAWRSAPPSSSPWSWAVSR